VEAFVKQFNHKKKNVHLLLTQTLAHKIMLIYYVKIKLFKQLTNNKNQFK